MAITLTQISNNKKLLGSLYSFTVSFTFCLHFFVAKDVLQTISPIVLGGMRGVFGGLLLYAIYFRQIKGHLNPRSLTLLIAIAFFGYFINQILFLNGLKRSTPLNTSIIMNMIPIVAALIAMAFKVESFSWKKIGGSIIGFATLFFLTLYTSKHDLDVAKTGDLLIFSSVITLCTGTMLTRMLVKTGFPSPIISASMLFLGGLGLSCLEIDKLWTLVDYSLASDINLAKIIFEIVISTAFTYLLSFKALSYLPPSQSMVFIYLQPLMVAGIDYVIYSKIPPLILIPIFIGVGISTYIVMAQESH
ncbi:MAG: DMT family transporter [Methylococcales bacterium]|nr:DMT family transporter [Methylococcales bacterium]